MGCSCKFLFYLTRIRNSLGHLHVRGTFSCVFGTIMRINSRHIKGVFVLMFSPVSTSSMQKNVVFVGQNVFLLLTEWNLTQCVFTFISIVIQRYSKLLGVFGIVVGTNHNTLMLKFYMTFSC